MSKSDSIQQKIFGSTGPTGSIAVFGSLKSGTSVYSDDAEQIESLQAWTDGWSSALVDGTKPCLQDFNGLFSALTYQNAYAQQAGIPEYNAQMEYFIGSLVSDGAGTIYCSNTNNNVGNALTDKTNWFNWFSINVRTLEFVSTSYDYYLNNSDKIILFNVAGVTGWDGDIYLPSAAGNQGREIIIRSLIYHFAVFRIRVDGGGPIYRYNDSNSPTFITQSFNKSVYLICDGITWYASYQEA